MTTGPRSRRSTARQGTVTHFLLRTAGDPATMLTPARAAIREVSPQLVVTATHLIDDRVAGSIPRRGVDWFGKSSRSEARAAAAGEIT
jgi:hypothetical protein